MSQESWLRRNGTGSGFDDPDGPGSRRSNRNADAKERYAAWAAGLGTGRVDAPEPGPPNSAVYEAARPMPGGLPGGFVIDRDMEGENDV